MPQIFTLKNALLTIENFNMFPDLKAGASNKLQDYQIEIAYDLDNKPFKLWIHNKDGITLIRIQEKEITPWSKGTSQGVKQKVAKDAGQSQGTTFQ